MSKPKPINPRRGEVWDVILESNTDKEPQKSQSAVVINTDGLNSLAPRLVIQSLLGMTISPEQFGWFKSSHINTTV